MDKKLSKKQKTMLGVGVVVAGALLLFSRNRKAGSDVTLTLQPVDVGANELVNAASYRIITNRRSGMKFAPATGTVGGKMEFTSPVKGKFTRNILQEGGQLLAEIKG